MLLVQFKLDAKDIQKAQLLLDIDVQTKEQIEASFGTEPIDVTTTLNDTPDYKDISLGLALIVIAKQQKENKPLN